MSIAERLASRFLLPKRIAARYFQERYARLLLAMSVQEAKSILGFPPNSSPSADEINKAYKKKVIENHPDRGGSHEKMVEVNVAKDVLDGKQNQRWQPDRSWGGPGPYKRDPRPEPPKVVETIEGVSFQEALSKAGVLASIEWKCISKPTYAPTKDKRYWYNYIWTLIGKTDQKIWVLSAKKRLDNDYTDLEKGGKVVIKPDWQVNIVSMPADKDPLKMLPKLVRSPSVLFEDGTLADPPKKWVVFEGGKLDAKDLEKVRQGSGGANLKDVLAMVGLVSADAAGVSGRKSVVEIIPRYNLDKGRRRRQEQGGRLYTYQTFDYEIRVNGKSEMLAEDTCLNLEKNGFVMGVFGYDPPDGKPKQLHKLRGGRFGTTPGVAIRLLADSLTSEASWLHIALEKAAEEWEMDDAKAKAASIGMSDAALLFGVDLLDVVFW